MSSTNPPNPNVNTFNNLYWSVSDIPLTQSKADKRYLKYPVAQGKETLQAIDVNGVANFNQPITMTGPTANDRLIRSTYFAINNTSGNSVGNIYAVSNDVIYDNNRNTGKHIFKSNDSGGTETTIMTMDTSNVLVYDPFISSNTNYLNRVIGTTSYQILDLNASPSVTGTIECESGNNNISYTNSKNSGLHKFYATTSGGALQNPVTINTDGILLNTAGDYLQFPDGTKQYTAAVTTAASTYTVAYNAPTTSVTIPANCWKIDLIVMGGGGLAGTAAGSIGNYWYGGSGGSGAWAMTCNMAINAGSVLNFNFSGPTGQGGFVEVTWAKVGLLARCLNGNNGGNASIGNVGAGAAVGSQAPALNNSFATWQFRVAQAGLTPPTNTINTTPVAGGAPLPYVWNQGAYGMGQLTSLVGQPTGLAGVIITYYISS